MDGQHTKAHLQSVGNMLVTSKQVTMKEAKESRFLSIQLGAYFWHSKCINHIMNKLWARFGLKWTMKSMSKTSFGQSWSKKKAKKWSYPGKMSSTLTQNLLRGPHRWCLTCAELQSISLFEMSRDRDLLTFFIMHMFDIIAGLLHAKLSIWWSFT